MVLLGIRKLRFELFFVVIKQRDKFFLLDGETVGVRAGCVGALLCRDVPSVRRGRPRRVHIEPVHTAVERGATKCTSPHPPLSGSPPRQVSIKEANLLMF